MRAALIAIFVFGAAVSCAEEPEDLLGQKLPDAGSDRDGGSDAGPADATPHDFGPETGPTCCTDLTCPACNGRYFGVGGCGPEWCDWPFPDECPPIPSERMCDCSGFSETECRRADWPRGCKPHICDGVYAGCIAQDESPPCNSDCNGLDEVSCNAAPNCHRSYADSPICDCDEPGCCMMYDHCAPGAEANCNDMALCNVVEPVCGDGFSIDYANECYEGCARNEDCAP